MSSPIEPAVAAEPADSDEALALLRIGAALSSELDLDRLVQRLTDEATTAVRAQLGAFFYNVTDDSGESFMLYTLSGVPREAFSKLPMPRNTALFGTTFRAEAVVRLDDVRQDPRFGENAPHHGMPEGHLPVVSYLAVPVVARGTGEVIGGLFFGHPEPARFTAQDERFVVAIARHAAIAIENARLVAELRHRREEDARKARLAALSAEIGAVLTRAGSFLESLRACVQRLSQHGHVAIARIWVCEGNELALRASAGGGEVEDTTQRAHPGEGAIGRIALERRALTADGSEESLPATADPTLRYFAGLPLESDGSLIGVLTLRSREPFTSDTLENLRPVASLLALGIRRAHEQERLLVSELKHRLVAEASNEGIWFWDLRTDAVEWNDRLLEMLGLRRDDWGGGFTAWFERVHPEDQSPMRAALDAHLARRVPYAFERFRLRDASGEYRICRTRGQAEWDASGAPLHMAGAVVDVTSRVRAQEALTASEHRYRQILDSVRDMVFCKEPGSKVVYSNAAACAHYGMSPEDLAGLGGGPTSPSELTEKYARDDREVFERGAVVEDLEEPNVRHDGELRYFHVVKSPVRDRDGRVVELVGVARDITERKRHEDDQRFLGEASALLASSIDYQTTFANLARLAVPRFADWCAIDVLDEQGAIQRVAVAHVDPAKVELAHEVARRWPPDPSAETGAPAVIRHGRSEVHLHIPDELLDAVITDAELLRIVRDLGLRSSICVPLTVHGKTLGALTLIGAESGRRYDPPAVSVAEELARRAAVALENARLYRSARRAVDERARALETVKRFNVELERRVDERTSALAEANRELESFSYTVSHDLRAPIRHISGFVDLLTAHAGDSLDDKSKRWLRTIGDASKQMGTLIDALLAFSRMGRTALGRDRVDLDTLVREVLTELEPDLQDRRIEWSIQPLPTVVGDPTMLRVVLTNLVSNAAKYTRARDVAHIEIGAVEEPSGEVKLWVRDDGIGFNMAYSHKLFGVFQRLHTSAEVEGTGIGLATVRRIVQRHGGRAWGEGAPDQGATFYVTLPSSARAAGGSSCSETQR